MTHRCELRSNNYKTFSRGWHKALLLSKRKKIKGIKAGVIDISYPLIKLFII